jgi:hypothetical protein
MSKHNFRKDSGIALIMALLALLLVSAVGLGMIYMSTTETSINQNYKDTQTAFFSMRGGLEEMRERMRTQSLSYIGAVTGTPMPTTQMPGNPGSIFYITNPSAGEVVTPLTFGTTYFDDEFCHESFSGLPYVGPGTACNAAGSAPAASVTTIASNSPYNNTAASLKYKWVRLTLKQNGTFPNALVDSTQSTAAGLASQVCWNTSTSQEVVSLALGYANCAAAKAAGLYVEPLYLVTSLAITPQGSRRVGQYEAASLSFTPPPGAVALDGPTPVFNPPNSSNGAIDGFDGSSSASGVAPPALPAGSAACGAGPTAPAIGTDNGADATVVSNDITVPPGTKPGNFTGSPPPGDPAGTTPSVAPGTGMSNWSSPAALNSLVSSIADGADVKCTGNTGACSGSTFGTPAAPQTTYVNGNFTFPTGGGAGVLVVTGTLTISGKMQFDGLILVIGAGNVQINGGGDGQIFGELFIANTQTLGPGGILGIPTMSWNGGGKSSVNYNSCWADLHTQLHYQVVAAREEMY